MIRKTLVFAVSPLAAVLTLGACASTGITPELADARREYDEARFSDANRYAPDRLLEAKQALDKAEVAHADEPGSFRETSLAYIAQRRVRIAQAYGNLERSRREQVAATEQYRVKQDALRREAERRASQERESLERAQGETSAAQRELGVRNQELAAREKELAQRDQRLATSQADLERERRARAEAEKQAAAALASLEEVAKVKEEARGTVITLDGEVLFVTGKSELLPIAQQRLDRVAQVLKMYGDEKSIVVEGHTDSRGSNDMNMRLSIDRANSVRNYLVSRGVNPDRIRAVGYGENRPVAPNETAEGRAQNRRVELVIQDVRRSNAR